MRDPVHFDIDTRPRIRTNSRAVNLFFSLAPAPAFLLGAVYSWLMGGVPVCGAGSYEMTIMWLVMALAHVSPWLFWYQQREYHKFQTRPDKQQ